jgi:hypothetical protein
MLKSISENDWIKFLNNSKNATIYHHPTFLRIFNEKLDFKCYLKGDEIILGLPLLKKKNNIQLRFQGYNGFIYPDRHLTKKQKIISSNFKGLKEFADFFYENYESLSISLDDTMVDARPFIWHNYPKSIFKTEEYYTSKIELKDFSKACISDARRQEIIKSEKQGLKINVSENFKSAAEFFIKTIGDSNFENDEIRYFEIMKSLSDSKMGKLFSCNYKNDVISFAFFGIINKKVFYMFSGSDHNLKNISNHTYLLYEVINKFKKEAKEIDFVGVNSPNRGSFKLSFGGNLNRCLRLTMINK